MPSMNINDALSALNSALAAAPGVKDALTTLNGAVGSSKVASDGFMLALEAWKTAVATPVPADATQAAIRELRISQAYTALSQAANTPNMPAIIPSLVAELGMLTSNDPGVVAMRAGVLQQIAYALTQASSASILSKILG
jgi:hypothetical protein